MSRKDRARKVTTVTRVDKVLCLYTHASVRCQGAGAATDGQPASGKSSTFPTVTHVTVKKNF
jgi:hypothetical protein